MRLTSLTGLALAAAFLSVDVTPARAEGDPRLAQVVVKVGEQTVTVADLERRMKTVPRFQLATFGATADEVKRHFVERVIVPELLLAAGARERKTEEQPVVKKRVGEVLRGARLAAVRAEIVSSGVVSPADVQKYYDDNKARFDTPERVSVWRIRRKSRKDAEEVIAEAKKASSPTRWSELAREKSTDTTTSMRAGNLGFLSPEGVSTDQGVKVAPEIIAAASKLKDGEIGGEPVAENGQFAVIWRRGSMPAVKRTVEQEQTAIRDVLIRKRVEDGTKSLVQGLRDAKLRSYNSSVLEGVEIDDRGQVGPKGAASAAAKAVVPRKPGSPAPSGSPLR